jgi:hypothetical protein
LEKLVNESGFAVVNVSDDGKVADIDGHKQWESEAKRRCVGAVQCTDFPSMARKSVSFFDSVTQGAVVQPLQTESRKLMTTLCHIVRIK